jgi:hypothetical protein
LAVGFEEIEASVQFGEEAINLSEDVNMGIFHNRSPGSVYHEVDVVWLDCPRHRMV